MFRNAIQILLLLLSALAVSERPCALDSQPHHEGIFQLSCDTISKGYQCSPKISHRWGTNSPFYSVPSRISNAVPPGCEITFVNILVRHGARFPTVKKTKFYRKTIAYIQKNTSSKKYSGKYAFLKRYRFNLGVGDLTTFGEQELVNAGIQFYRRYPKLSRRNSLFLRSAGMERVVLSCLNFTQGFHEEKAFFVPDRPFPYPMLVIAEGSNSTLSHDVCPAFENGPKYGKMKMAKWAETFVPPIARRLSKDLGVNLNVDQTLAVLAMCPFQTMADPKGNMSEFCYLFTRTEWDAYDHYETLNKWYGSGPGNPLGPTQGVGYTNELIARLTNKPVIDQTSTNHTLDTNSATFPLNNALYADFTHNTDMVSTMFAMNLFDNIPPKPYKRLVDGFNSDSAVPFAARVIVEKMVCKTRKTTTPELVRVLVNDRVIPLKSCNADRYGRCTVTSYINSLSFARGMGLWNKCHSV